MLTKFNTDGSEDGAEEPEDGFEDFMDERAFAPFGCFDSGAVSLVVGEASSHLGVDLG